MQTLIRPHSWSDILDRVLPHDGLLGVDPTLTSIDAYSVLSELERNRVPVPPFLVDGSSHTTLIWGQSPRQVLFVWTGKRLGVTVMRLGGYHRHRAEPGSESVSDLTALLIHLLHHTDMVYL